MSGTNTAIFPMTDTNQKQLGNTLWSIADQLRGAMDADVTKMIPQCCRTMLSFIHFHE
jgi:hypothetical protein